MILTAPRRDRLADLILADTESVRLLDAPHPCRTVEQQSELIDDHAGDALRFNATSEPECTPLLSPDALVAGHLNDQLNRRPAT
jgi:hypothetical protein